MTNQVTFNVSKKWIASLIKELYLHKKVPPPEVKYYNRLREEGSNMLIFQKAINECKSVTPLLDDMPKGYFEKTFFDKYLVKMIRSFDQITNRNVELYLVFRYINLTHSEKISYRFKTEDEGKEVFGKAFYKFIRRIKKKEFDHKGMLSTFFFKILKDESFNHFNPKKVNKEKQAFTYPQESGFEDLLKKLPQSRLMVEEKMTDHYDLFMWALKQLSPKCQEILKAYYIDNIPLVTIAELQGKTRNNITVQKNDCLKKLRDIIKSRPK